MKKKEFRFSYLSPECLLRYLMKHWWMILSAAAICVMCVSIYANLLYTPRYQSSATYAVMSRKTSYTSSANVSSAKEVAGVMTEMLATNLTREHIRDYDPELENFSGTVRATQVSGSNFIIIRVTAPSPKTAFLAMQAIGDLLPVYTDYVASDNVVQLVRNPTVSSAPVNPVNSRRFAASAALLGAGAMAVLLGWFFVQQETIQTRSAARHLLEADVIATIYEENRRRGLKRLLRRGKQQPLQVFSPTTSFGYTEQINTICTRMEHTAAAHGSRIFLITGVGAGEGKTTVAGNVAAALSGMGKRVALLDCDLRNPSLNRFYGGKYASDMPLNKLLSQPLTKDSVMQCILRHEKLGVFQMFPSGPDRRCTELLNNEVMDELLRQLRVFDYVILDSPPAGYFAEAEALAQKVDATLLVVRKDVATAEEINRTVATLRASRSRFLGCILNGMTHSVTEGYGYGYGQHKQKKSTRRGKKGG